MSNHISQQGTPIVSIGELLWIDLVSLYLTIVYGWARVDCPLFYYWKL